MGIWHHTHPGLKVAESGFGFRMMFCALRRWSLFLVTSVVLIAMVTQWHHVGSPMDVLVVLLRQHRTRRSRCGDRAPGLGFLAGEVAAPCPMSGPSHGFGLQSGLGLAATPDWGFPPRETKSNHPSTQTCPGRILNAFLEH